MLPGRVYPFMRGCHVGIISICSIILHNCPVAKYGLPYNVGATRNTKNTKYEGNTKEGTACFSKKYCLLDVF